MSESSTYSISKYFFKPNGMIEIPPPGAHIHGEFIRGLRRPPRTPRERPAKRNFVCTPLRAGTKTSTVIVPDEADEEDDEEIEVMNPLRPAFEFEELDDDEEQEEQEEEQEEQEEQEEATNPANKHFFVESVDEAAFITSSKDIRANETLINKKVWMYEDIQSFFGGMSFTDKEIDEIIILSKQVQRIKRKILADVHSYQNGIIDANEFRLSNAFDYRSLREALDQLYTQEQRPRQHLIIFAIPGSKPRFIVADTPCYLPIIAKKHSIHMLFMPEAKNLQRILYCAQPTTNQQEPLTLFGCQKPLDIMRVEPQIQAHDEIITALMKRDWDLEKLFTLPELW